MLAAADFIKYPLLPRALSQAKMPKSVIFQNGLGGSRIPQHIRRNSL